MHDVIAHDARIPALGLGTWTLNGPPCTELVAHALSIGYRHVDTAASYGNEEAVGAGIRASAACRATKSSSPPRCGGPTSRRPISAARPRPA